MTIAVGVHIRSKYRHVYSLTRMVLTQVKATSDDLYSPFSPLTSVLSRLYT